MTDRYSELPSESSQLSSSQFCALTQVPSFGYYTDLLAREDNPDEDLKVILPPSFDQLSLPVVAPQPDICPTSDIISIHSSPFSNSITVPVSSPQDISTPDNHNPESIPDPLASGNNASPEPSQETLLLPSSNSSTICLQSSTTDDSSDEEEQIGDEELSENDRLARSIGRSVGESIWNFSSNCAKKLVGELFGVNVSIVLCIRF